MIEGCRMKIEDLRSASGGSILARPKKKPERSDYPKYTIFNLHYSMELKNPARVWSGVYLLIAE